MFMINNYSYDYIDHPSANYDIGSQKFHCGFNVTNGLDDVTIIIIKKLANETFHIAGYCSIDEQGNYTILPKDNKTNLKKPTGDNTEYKFSLDMKGHSGTYGCVLLVPDKARGDHKSLYSDEFIEIHGHLLEPLWLIVLEIGIAIIILITIGAAVSLGFCVYYRRKNKELQKTITQLRERGG